MHQSVFFRFDRQNQDQKFTSLENIKHYQPFLLNNQEVAPTLPMLQSEISPMLMPTHHAPSEFFAENVLLTGHSGEVTTVKFSHDGKYLASSGHDRQVLVWDIYHECKNTGFMRGQKNVVLQIDWSLDDTRLFSASADKTIAVFDVESNTRIRKLTGHTSYVNSVNGSNQSSEILVTGSDDGTARVWDLRQKCAAYILKTKYPILTVCFARDDLTVFTGGLDNEIKIWQSKKAEVEEILYGHLDTVTGVSLSSNGNFLLSNSMDQTLKVWDVRPYCDGDRCLKIFQGATHGFEKNLLRSSWSQDVALISSGSSDGVLYIWDTTSRQILHRMAGHNGSINETHFSPAEKLIASGGSDKNIYVSKIPKYGLAMAN